MHRLSILSQASFPAEDIAQAGPALRQLHPDLEQRLGKPLEQAVVGRRPGGRDKLLAPGANVSMESPFYLNYSRQPRVVRGPHVDRPSELFAALLYFRHADDPSTGGCLEVCEAKSPGLYDGRRGVRISTLPAESDDELVNTVTPGGWPSTSEAGGTQPPSASSSTSTQWRTGVSVPACRCWMQPMLAETMAWACRGARAASLRSRNCLDSVGCSTE